MSARDEVIRVGQVWVSRDARDDGLTCTVLALDFADQFGNGFVTVQRLRKSRMRASTLRSRYRLVKDVSA